MKLKLDENGHVVVQDGKPVYVQDDGKEVAFDAAGTVQTISRLNGEAKSHRERAEAAEGRLDAFKGIEDPAAAVKALETVKNLDDKKLVDAGEVEKVKSEVSKGFQAQIDEARAQLAQANQNLASHMIGGSFARSQKSWLCRRIWYRRDSGRHSRSKTARSWPMGKTATRFSAVRARAKSPSSTRPWTISSSSTRTRTTS